MQYRTEPYIFLGTTGNIQVSHWFLNLRTGRRIKRHKFTPLPDPPHSIARVHEIPDEDNQNPALDLCDCYRNPIEDASLANITITAHDSDISRVGGIGFKNTVMDRLGN